MCCVLFNLLKQINIETYSQSYNHYYPSSKLLKLLLINAINEISPAALPPQAAERATYPALLCACGRAAS